jgi:hypothetical protein
MRDVHLRADKFFNLLLCRICSHSGRCMDLDPFAHHLDPSVVGHVPAPRIRHGRSLTYS